MYGGSMGVKKKPLYQFEGGVVRIEDPDLNLDITSKGVDIKLPKDHEPSHLKGGVRYQVEKSQDNSILSAHTEKEGRLHGQWSLYYPDGAIKSLAHYYEGDLHGPSTFYSKEGNLLSETWFVLGKRVGRSHLYYLSKKIYSTRRYRENLLDGKQEYYYENGSIKTLMHYEMGPASRCNQALLSQQTAQARNTL